jgi:NAD(P)H dehydrogenase (quinone)
MILISGAAGKTGQAVIKALKEQQQPVRAFVRSAFQKQQVEALGIEDVLIGDLLQASDIQQAFAGIHKVLHICPNVHPDEMKIGALIMAAAKQARLEQFVFHSVLHPQLEAMPHHWQKMRVEEMLIESGIPFTIVQPASYMQNLALDTIRSQGVLRVPYDLRARHSMVDLADIARVYARILVEHGHLNAIYELAGPQALDQYQVAEVLSQGLGQTVTPVQQSIADWRQKSLESGLSAYAIETLVKMFEHYDQHGFAGNSNTLQYLLNHPPTSLADWVNNVVCSPDK